MTAEGEKAEAEEDIENGNLRERAENIAKRKERERNWRMRERRVNISSK